MTTQEDIQWIHKLVSAVIADHNLKPVLRISVFDKENLIGAAMEGYVKALKAFDETKGIPFKKYASYRIKGSVLDEVRKAMGDERIKNKKPKLIYDYDFGLFKYQEDPFIWKFKYDNEIDNFIESLPFKNTDKQILFFRLTGMNQKQIAQKCDCSQYWVSIRLRHIQGFLKCFL